MIKKVLLFLAVLAFTACNNSQKFTVTGTISDAKEQMLYFEYAGLVKDSLIDSVKLDAGGSFKFKSKRSEYPDLYRLRLGNQHIMLGVDSSETITVKAKAQSLIDAQFENSVSSTDIQKLRISVLNLQNKAIIIGNEKDEASQKILIDSFIIKVNVHKKMVMDLILKNTRSIAAYFALYQQVNGLYIVSPYEKDGRKYFSAVATAYDTYMPDYERTKNLHNAVIAALQQNKAESQQQLIQELQNKSGIGFPEIELIDNKGSVQKLTSLKGKTILIDFSAVEMENNVDYTFALRDIYNKYSAQGLQIYQISLDDNKMMWERSVANLPWICVRDENGAASHYTAVYNVQSIPTLFLIDKAGNIVGRYSDFETLLSDIKRVI